MATTVEVNISGLQAAIDKAEKSIRGLAETTANCTRSITEAFKNAATQGVDALNNKLVQAGNTLKNISGANNASKSLDDVGKSSNNAADKIAKITSIISSQSSQWTSWQRIITNTEGEIKRIQTSMSNFEQKKAAFNTANSKGPISRDEQKDYELNKAKLQTLQQQLSAYKQIQSNVAAKIRPLQQELNVLQQLTQQEKQRTSLPQLKKDAELQQMGQYYTQLDATIKKERELYEQRAKNAQLQNAKKNTTYEGAMKFSEKATGGTENRQAKAIEYLTAARKKLTTTDADYASKVENINQAIRKHDSFLKGASKTTQETSKQKQKAYQNEQKALKQKQEQELRNRISSSPDAALKYSREAKTINDQIKAIQNLKQVRDSLDRTSFTSAEAYRKKVAEINKEIQRQQGEVKKLQGNAQQAFNNMNNALGPLQQRLGALFGISALKGYVNKLISIRGEFEMQHRSLEILLQSKDKADKLWKQTVDLAVKSPFTVRQLITYTKQLAAYRVESEKLFETNKMLADVSAGLGVDMQRLILAFGQVKAANFLRGTELRQFSEAGVNMLEELAKRFTALEGKAISVGDVFARVSKRMVSFKDVEAVFQTITSEGGLFFRMQERQSETLKGMMLNLKDSIDLMLNSIGQSTNGVLKGSVKLVKDFVENWRSVRDNLMMLIPALVLTKVAMFGYTTAINKNIVSTFAFNKGLWAKIMNFKAFRNAIISITVPLSRTPKLLNATTWAISKLEKGVRVASVAVKGLGMALKSFLPFAIITAVMELVYWLVSANEETKAFRESVEAINEETRKDLEKSISLYIQLAKEIRSTTSTEDERTKALQRMNSALGEILPAQYLELKYITDLKGGYNDAIDAMRVYYANKRKEQQIDAVEESYGKAISKESQELKDDFYDLIDKGFKRIEIDKYFGKGFSDDLAAGYEQAIDKAIQDVKIGKSDSFKDSFLAYLGEWTGRDGKEIMAVLKAINDGTEFKGVTKNIRNVSDAIKNFHLELEKVIDNIYEYSDAQEKRVADAGKTVVDDEKKAVEHLEKLASIAKKIATSGNRTFEDDKLATNAIQTAPLRYQQALKVAWEGLLEKAQDSSLDFTTYVNKIKQNALATIATIGNEASKKSENEIKEIEDVMDAINKALKDAVKDGGFTYVKEQDYLTLFEKIPSEYQAVFGKMYGEIKSAIGKGAKDIDAQLAYTNDILKKRIRKSNSYVENFNEILKKSLDKNVLTEQGEAVTEVYKKVSKSLGVNESIFERFVLTNEKSLSDLLGELKGKADEIGAEWKKIQTSLDNNLAESEWMGIYGFEKSEAKAKIAELKKNQLAVTTAWHQLGGDEKDKNRKNWLLELAKILQGVHKDYLTLNKDLNATRAKEMALFKNTEALETAFSNASIAMDAFMSSFDLTTEEGFIRALEYLISTLPTKAQAVKIEMEKMLGNAKGEVELSVAINTRSINEQVLDNLFQDVELSLELEGEGMDVNAFAKLFGFSKKNTNDIRKYIQKQIGLDAEDILPDENLLVKIFETDKISKEDKSRYSDAIEKLRDIEAKELEKTIKKFNELSLQALTSVGKIRINEARELKSINRIIDEEIKKAGNDTEKIAEYEKMREALIQGTKEKSEKDVNKAIWEEFKGSDGYITLFQDAQNASYRAINNMLDNLERFRDSLGELNVEELKAVVEAMEKLKQIKFEKMPFTNLAKMIQAGIDQAANRKDRKALTVEGDSKNGITAVEAGGFSGIKGKARLNKSINEYTKAIDELRKKQATQSAEEASKTDATIKGLIKKRQELEKVRAKGEQASRDLSDGFLKFASKLNEVGQSLSTFQNAFENMGVNFSDGMKDAISTTQEVLGGVSSMVQGIASGNYLQALMGLAQTLGALFQIGDKRKERQIQDNIKAIEKLGKAYEKLEKKIEEAYSIETLQSATNMAMDNLEEQIRKQEEIIELEKSKKKSDEDKLDDYIDELDSQMEQLEEMKKEVVSKATNGAFDDVLSVADEFVDAWLTAFQETGDGLSGLEDNFNEFMLNIIKRQASMQIVGAYANKWKEQLEKYVNANDTKLTTDEALKFAESVKADMPELSEALKAYFEAMKGVVDINGEGDTMSGLQRGVTEITEETAGVIAAYLDSLRFYVADNNTQLKQFLQNYNASANTYLSPILTQVTNIANDTSEIKSLLSSIISTYTGNAGGKGVKMIM